MRIFGIVIEKRTDILAFAAFLLSVAGLLSQAVVFLIVVTRGPVVTLFTSEQIMLISDQLEESGPMYVRVNAQMAYTNSGAPGKNVVIKREIVKLQLDDGLPYQQRWQTFETFDIVDKELMSISKEPASPQTVSAGDAASHDTYFVPFRHRCHSDGDNCDEWRNFLTWNDFLSKIERLDVLKVTLIGEIYGHEQVEVSCVVQVDRNLRDRLKDYGWHAPSCWQAED